MSVRRAALVVVIALVTATLGVPIAEFVIWPRIVDADSIEQTVLNIQANEGLFLVASFAYLTAFVGDVVVAWALYYLLRPVSRSLAALAAAFRGVQAIVSIGAALNLFTALRLIKSEPLAASGTDQVHWQAWMLLRTFGYEWSLALVIFGIHLGLVGYLVYRSGYIPRLIGIATAMAGAGYVVHNLQAYLYPGAEIGFVFALLFGELVFVAWLAVWGWRIPDPTPASDSLDDGGTISP